MTEHQEQAMSIPNETESIQAKVRHDLRVRERVGVQRYGTPLQAHNGRDALRDAYEEALDLACYLRQAIEERAALPDHPLAVVDRDNDVWTRQPDERTYRLDRAGTSMTYDQISDIYGPLTPLVINERELRTAMRLMDRNGNIWVFRGNDGYSLFASPDIRSLEHIESNYGPLHQVD